ncbi:response regulator [Methylobacterium sp. CCH5-D2]|uniref:response regulator n=1 Tax=Methylobacterium sp. CCH5-D2 TaxID=1768765 RepID=UPI0009E88EB1|nr:response regulator [Methylobacterium sp. CCH5-D2]
MRRADNVFQSLSYEPATTTAHGVAHGLADTYAELVDVELPDALGSLVLLLKEREAPVWKHLDGRRTPPLPTKLVVVVEDDPAVRELAVAMLEETVLDVVACASAEEALAVLGKNADSVAMLFTDVQLAGEMDGVQLACLASRNWPNVRLVVTSGGAGDRAAGLPGKAVYLDKPWRALDVLVQVDQAVRLPGPPCP